MQHIMMIVTRILEFSYMWKNSLIPYMGWYALQSGRCFLKSSKIFLAFFFPKHYHGSGHFVCIFSPQWQGFDSILHNGSV